MSEQDTSGQGWRKLGGFVYRDGSMFPGEGAQILEVMPGSEAWRLGARGFIVVADETYLRQPVHGLSYRCYETKEKAMLALDELRWHKHALTEQRRSSTRGHSDATRARTAAHWLDLHA